ncbi:class IV adenylate cyclase [Actinoplanes oblitus]|uniref:Class IV adenylate cyclase n=1 Tax=Actinoplanes oblitus TaxID=3040509 RepID=A0ABY8WQ92_9ACTN|nr:class IV adenylate cyclase [Actinoplanes oblitus]WIN00070.1 class IV adenylate cyclase [Actinoplanes oblitus]
MTAEIEVKYQVADVEGLLAAIREHGIALSEPVEQDDQAYAPIGWQFGDARIGVTFVRLRRQGGRCVFTTKTPVDNVLACVEHETEVSDATAMHAAILAMGYQPTVKVVKTRRTGRVGAWSVCLDAVVGAGAFFEVEAVAEDADGMLQVQAQMDAWVQGLGVPVERTGATYDEVVSRSAVAAS